MLVNLLRITHFLQETAQDLGTNGWDSTYGYGRIDVGAAMATLGTVTTPELAYSIAPL